MEIAADDPHYVDWYWLQESLEQAGSLRPKWTKEDDPGRYLFHGDGFSAPTIVDLLEAQNLSWECYAEDLPPDAEYKDKLNYELQESPQDNLENVPRDVLPFARKHVPFLSFPSIVAGYDRSRTTTASAP